MVPVLDPQENRKVVNQLNRPANHMDQLHRTNARNVRADGPGEDRADLENQGEEVHLEANVRHGLRINSRPIIPMLGKVAGYLRQHAADYL